MSNKGYFKGSWVYIIAALCLVIGSVGPLFGYLNVAASTSSAEAATTIMFDDDDDCEDALFATLTGPTINGQMPRGFAQFKLDGDDDDQGHNRLKVFVRFVNLPENTILDVFVDGTFVGQITLRANGNSRGFFDPSFNITAGSVVEVRNGSTVILSGTFHECEEGTPTGTPSGSPTHSPTGTHTATPSGTPSHSPSGTPSHSPTGTPSHSPTGTPSHSPSGSPSHSPSGTPSHSPSGTPSHSPTGTHSPTPSGTPTHSPSASPTGTPTCFTIVPLSGANEVPPTGSTGGGIGSGSLSPDLMSITVNVAFSGLSSPATAAHIHGPAPAGSIAPVLFPLAGVPTSTSGFIPTQTFAITPTQLTQFQQGLFYFNVHTANFPGGEIRGQIVPSAGCTATPTATNTPTGTPTHSPSGTPTHSPSGTPTHSPSGTPTPAARLFTARLNGENAVPSVETSARGFAGVVLNPGATEVQVAVAFANLSSAQTSATINCPAIPGQNAPVALNLGAVGGTSGLVNGTFSVTPLEAAALQAGLCYVVIGSQNNSGGEIRGQLTTKFMHRDFDGDGKSDIALFRPSNGTWYYLNSSDNHFTAGQFGTAGDKPIGGDFDGDGRGEYAVFRSVGGSGVWYVRNSSDQSFITRQWGLGTDVPMSGDFDGDGRSDLAVFRPSDGNWYVSRSSNGSLMATHWGQNGDVPVSGDFDGDGTNDIAVFRPSSGVWYINRSSDGTYATLQWGLQGDKPVSGDFDGDGTGDVAVFRPSDGNWYINGSRGTFLSMHFGANGDIPVAGRFDGDDKTDIAVFRPSEGNWYILKSQTNAVTATNFGLSGDMPIVNY